MNPVPVSMVMITRNNHDTLDAILHDAMEAGCDELCVLDTGSTDDTIDIAKRAGAHVYTDEWVDDFAHSRNRALKKAKHDWCLMLDSDDRISNPLELRRFFRDDLPRLPESCHAIRMDVNVGIGPQMFTTTHTRLLKRSSGLHFRYPIHETVICDGHDVYHLREVRIEHLQPFDIDHNRRNLKILLKHYHAIGFSHEPQDVQQHIRLNLGREYLGTKRNGEAVAIFAEFFERANSVQLHDYWARMYFALATTDKKLKLERFQAATNCNPYRAEAWVEWGRMLVNQKKYRAALTPLGRAIHCAHPGDGIAYTPDYTWRPLILIAVCADAPGEHEKAHIFAQAAAAKGAPAELLRQTVA